MPDPISWALAWPWLLLVAAIAWGLGGLPFAVLICRLGGHRDPRQVGSGNPGVSNVLRTTGSLKLGLLTALADLGKGWGAVTLGAAIAGRDGQLVAAFFVVLGHCFPPWSWLRGGGKGMAPTLGALSALVPFSGALALLSWALLLGLTRLPVVATLVTLLFVPLWVVLETAVFWVPPWSLTFGRPDGQRVLCTLLIILLVIIRHRENMWRLWRGKEKRIPGGDRS